MTKEYEDLLKVYCNRVELYFKENKFAKHGLQDFIFWKNYIKYCIDTQYNSLATEVLHILIRKKIILCNNNIYKKLYYHKNYKHAIRLQELQWN